MAMGIRPSVVVGDADSIDQEFRQILDQLPVKWICDPALAQEQSDLEMALEYALSLQPSEIIICGALGGDRVDHTLSNLFLLILPFRAGIPARIIDERQTVRLMDRELTVKGQAGEYALIEETLYFASTRGLSNELLAETARITAASGLLLVIHTKRTSC